MDFSPLSYRLLRALRGRPTPADVCDRRWQLAPASARTAPRALYLPGEIEKISGCPALTSFAREMRRIEGGRREHAATVAYRLRGARIVGGSVYKAHYRWPLLVTKRSPWLDWGRAEALGEAALACTLFGSLFFGHWITDQLTLQLAAAPLAEPLAVPRTPYGHEPAYRRLLDLPPPRTVTHARCDALWVLEDDSLNAFKAERYHALRRRLQRQLAPAGRDGVLLRRGSAGDPRPLRNEEEVISFCESRGFAVVDPQAMPLDELMRRIMGARIVLGVEGSQLAHGLLAMQDDGAMLVLQPPYRFNNTFKDHTDCLGFTYAFVVGTPVQEGFRVDRDRLARTLDLVEARLAHPATGSASAGGRESAARAPSPSVSGAA